MTFAELHVPPALVTALAAQEITEPSPIQAAALPVLLARTSAFLSAETGTGKTLAYLLPLFIGIDGAVPATQAVILAPTHELAVQIQHLCGDLARDAGMAIRSLLLIGGTSMERQIEKLKTKPQVVVGSPGRVSELIRMGKLKTKAVRWLVVDEADRLLVGGSLGEVRAVVAALPAERQIVFASATRQAESSSAMAALAPGLAVLEAGAAAVNADITHLYLVCDQRDRIKVLRQLLAAMNPERALVFAQQNDLAERLTSQLEFHHITVAELHADFGKLDRKQAMEDFRNARVRVLVASDMAARGLDFPGVTHVFNVDAPQQSRAYLHRAGRTGRAGLPGVTVTLMSPDEVRLARRYEADLGITLQRVRLADGRLLAAGEPAPGE